MNDYLHSVCREVDPDQIQKLMTNKKHKARIGIIKKYLIKCYFNNFKDFPNKKEYLLVKNTYNFCKLVLPMSMLFGYFSYKYFFTGVYEFRSLYLNTASIPFPIKLIFSGNIAYYIFNKLWIDYSYNEEIYELAIRDYNKNKNSQEK
jgi:hypothetical protein